MDLVLPPGCYDESLHLVEDLIVADPQDFGFFLSCIIYNIKIKGKRGCGGGIVRFDHENPLGEEEQ